MKSSAWDNRLWQSKMQELPLYADANSAWNKMQELLDENMPVNAPAIGPKKPFGPFGTKLVSILGVVIVAGLLYYAATRVFIAHQHKSTKNSTPVVKQLTRPIDGINKSANDSADVLRKDDTRDNLPGNAPDKTNTNSEPTNIPAGKTGNNLKQQQQVIKNPGAIVGVNVASIKLKNSARNIDKNVTGNYRRHNSNGGVQSGSNGASYPGNIQNHSSTNTTANLGGSAGSAQMAKQTLNRSGDVKSSKGGSQNTIDSSLVSATTGSSAIITSPQITNNNSTTINTKIADSLAAIKKDIANKPQSSTPNNTLAGNRASTRVSRDKTTNNKSKKALQQQSYTRFGININTGLNTGTNSSAFLGLSGSYLIAPKLSVGVGIQLLPSKVISGSYSNHKYKYVTVGDSGKTTTNLADNIIVNSSVNINSADVPIIFSYKLNNYISINAGPIISIPVNLDNLKNTLGPITKPADTSATYKLISAAANSTTISNKVGVNLEGGLRVNISRFYIDGAYVHGINSYTISSSLGSSKVYYHTFQFGIGYWIFKPKPKPKLK